MNDFMQQNSKADNIDITQLAGFFKALADPTRLKIVYFLHSIQKPRCVGAISEHLQISQSATSQHLRILRQSNLVTSQRRGYHIHYEINSAQLDTSISQLQDMLKK